MSSQRPFKPPSSLAKPGLPNYTHLMRGVLLLLIAAIAHGAPPKWAIDASPRPPLSAEMERAWQVLSAGLTEEGLQLMKKAADAAPNDVEIQREYQIAMRNAGRYAKLKEQYEERLKREPRNPRAHLFVAELEPSVARYTQLINRSTKLAPQDEWLSSSAALLPIFEGLAKGGDPKSAIEKLEAIESPPKNLALYRGALFNAYLTNNQFDDARDIAKALSAQYPHSAQGPILLAYAAAAKRDEIAALSAIAAGLAIRDAVDLRVLRGQILWARGKQREALIEFDRAERSPRDDSCWECAMIVAYGYLGRFDDAAKLAPKAFKDRPWDISVRSSAASAMLRAGRLDEAITTAHSILKLSPGSAHANTTLGIAATLQGRHADALKFLTAALDSKPGDPSIRAFRALSYFHQGLEKEGIQEILESFISAPIHPEVIEAAVTVAAVFEKADLLFDRINALTEQDEQSLNPLIAAAMLHTRRNWFEHARANLKGAFDRVTNDSEGALVKRASEILDLQASLHRENYPLDHTAEPLLVSKGEISPRYPLLYVVDAALWTGRPWRAPAKRLWLDGASADPRTGIEWNAQGTGVFVSTGSVVEISVADGRVRPVISPPSKGKTLRVAYSRSSNRLARLIEIDGEGAPALNIEWINPRTGDIVELGTDPTRFPGHFTTANGKWGIERIPVVFQDPEITRVNLKDLSYQFLGIHGGNPSLSRNGKKLAYIHQKQELRIFDFSSGEQSAIIFSDMTPGERTVVEGPHWSPDSRYLAATFLDLNTTQSVIIDLKKRRYWMTEAAWSHVSWGPIPE